MINSLSLSLQVLESPVKFPIISIKSLLKLYLPWPSFYNFKASFHPSVPYFSLIFFFHLLVNNLLILFLFFTSNFLEVKDFSFFCTCHVLTSSFLGCKHWQAHHRQSRSKYLLKGRWNRKSRSHSVWSFSPFPASAPLRWDSVMDKEAVGASLSFPPSSPPLVSCHLWIQEAGWEVTEHKITYGGHLSSGIIQ